MLGPAHRHTSAEQAQHAQRARSTKESHGCHHGRTHAPHGGQLEDEPRPPAGHPPGAEARLDPARRQARLRRGRGRGASAVHRPAQRADPHRRRPAQAQARRPGPQRPRRRRLHRRDLGRLPGQARLHLCRGRPQRAAGVPRRDRRGRQRQAEGRLQARPDAHLLCRRGPRDPPGRRARRPRPRAGRGRAEGHHRGAGQDHRHRLRARLGHRHRRGRHPTGRPGGLRGDPHEAGRALLR